MIERQKGKAIRIPFRLGNLRRRLTLWYGTAFAVLLMLHIGVATYVHYRQLVSQAYHAEIQDLETTEGLLYQTAQGQIQMNESYFNRPQARLRLDRLLEVISPSGQVLYQDERLHGEAVDGAPLPSEGTNGSYNERALKLGDGRNVLVVSHFHLLNGRPIILRVAYDEAPLYANVARFLVLLLLIAPVTVLVALWVVYHVTGQALSPLRIMVRRAERITAERLNERLPVLDPSDDLGHAAGVFNELLQRLEDSFSQLKRFTSDASHELRTPLASLRSIGEVSLQNQHSDREYRDVIASMLEEVRRLTHLVESLLVISRADSGQIALQLSTFSCRDLIEEVTDLVGILAEDKHQTIRLIGDEELLVRADRSILRQAILNLVDNAIKYSPDGTEILIEVGAMADDKVEIDIMDAGPGIPAHEQTRIFDRFHRTDEGRSRQSGGAGLGLAIAKWAVEVQKGCIGVTEREGGGSRFYLRLQQHRDNLVTK
jgi:heavy metal sensor kinase